MKTNQRIWRTVAAVALLGGLSAGQYSCQGLTEKPDFISPTTFYRNTSDMRAALNGAYRELNNEWFNTYYNRSVFDCALGIQTGYEKGPQYYKQGGYAPTDDYINSYWAQNYRGINRANAVIERAPQATMTDAERKQLVAEAKFLRALYYYQLFAFFENVPVTDKPTVDLTSYAKNDGGKQKVLELIVSDLKAAETDLSATPDASGTPSRWAAKTLLAKAYLEQQAWQSAADKAKEVIDQSGIKLFVNFADNFSVANKNKGERLFEVQQGFTQTAGQLINNMHAHFTPTDWDGGDPTALTPGDNVTAAGWADAWIVGAIPFRESFAATDKRVAVTFMSQYRSKNANGEVVKYSPTAKSPFVAPGSPDRTFNNVVLQKFIEPNIGGWNKTEKNFIILRLADAYLAHSEAVNGGATGDAYLGINTVRARAGVPALSGLSKAALRDAIFDEWLKEFAGEGWAFSHARRFGKTADMIQKYAGRKVSDQQYRLLPMPFVEVNTNSGVKQNPGW